MKEALLQFIWKNTLFENREYTSDTGEAIKILDRGRHTTNQGSDFTECKIQIGDTTWAGNIEIHTRASDWYVHGHDSNPDYNNVILHVVKICDQSCYNQKGRQVPCILIDYNQELEGRYEQLMNSEQKIPCLQDIGAIDAARLRFCWNGLAVERLEEKTKGIADLLRACQGSWEEAFYIQLARCFGLKVNSLPFEMLAVSIPFKLLLKEPGNRLRIEAFLFGQAGFLEEEPQDAYTEQLSKEYRYQQKKYGLTPMEKHVWKFMRLRPLNFPTVRIAQFTALLARGQSMFAEVMKMQTHSDFVNYFSCEVSAYWKNHYKFGRISVEKEKKIGGRSIDLLIINAVLPFMFYFGKLKNKPNLQDRALSLLEQLPAEKNSISDLWNAANRKASNAVESQAQLQLFKSYCEPRRCLQCQIGHYVINRFRTCSAKA